MKRRMFVLVSAVALVATGCGSSDDATGSQDALKAELEAVTAERDELAARVAELEEQSGDTAPDTSEPEAPVETSEPVPEDTAAPETTAAPASSAGPAALDASPYVVAFGDLSAVAMPDGDPGG